MGKYPVTSSLMEVVVHRSGLLPMKIYYVNGVYYHWHEEWEFMINMEPSTVIVDGTTYQVGVGDVILVPGRKLHMRLQSGDYKGSLISIVVNPELWTNKDEHQIILRDNIQFQTHFTQQDPVDREIIELLHEIVHCYMQKEYAYEYQIKAMLSYTFTLLLRHHRYNILCNSASGVSQSPFLQLLAYVHEHFDQDLTLTDLSEFSHYSKHYIITLFRTNTTMTPAVYILKYRLNVSKSYLISGNDSILNIAMRCGFSSISYYNRAFKKETGMTPTAFRHHWFTEQSEQKTLGESPLSRLH